MADHVDDEEGSIEDGAWSSSSSGDGEEVSPVGYGGGLSPGVEEEDAMDEDEEEEVEEEEEEEEEDVDDDNVKALPPVAVPEGKTLSKHSWCCGRSKEMSPPASICSYDIKCPKWQCRYHTHVNNHDKEAFTCCYCEPHLKQGCECHG